MNIFILQYGYKIQLSHFNLHTVGEFTNCYRRNLYPEIQFFIISSARKTSATWPYFILGIWVWGKIGSPIYVHNCTYIYI